MAVASPYAVFKATDLSWFGPPAAQSPASLWGLGAGSAVGRQSGRRKRPASALKAGHGMVQGELFQLA